MTSYRDALHMLILVAAGRLGKEPVALSLEELDRDLVLAFLDELEEKRNNSVATRNARLAAVRSFFHHVAADDPATFGIAQRVLAIPTKRAHIEVTHHLTNAEVETIIAAPDQTTHRGRRDRALLLFLARTGARVSEAIGARIEDLALERGHRTLTVLRKGGKTVTMPLAPRTARAIDLVIGERFEGTILYGNDGGLLDRHPSCRVRRGGLRYGHAQHPAPGGQAHRPKGEEGSHLRKGMDRPRSVRRVHAKGKARTYGTVRSRVQDVHGLLDRESAGDRGC